ncbi:mitochondrial import inner membrane translocase subunit Tim9-like [Paramacrobiotus metropolitanus]|uniref:mitochondrial import inner membrane translocase subunit Tim9-like n=1 Tax=Paramacrobiotus metropolitanus TaxID=2943436 RepID=UPI002445A735|nr:mitochondrial import inner membrane translocase subunit Tim9-like [Paramacrobiotus metropolitanus]
MWGSSTKPSPQPDNVLMQQQQEQVKQLREFLLSYNKLSELCFNSCVHDFTTRKVLDPEDSCSLNCVEKYLKLNQRVSMRFQEYQTLQNEAALAVAQQAGHFPAKQ